MTIETRALALFEEGNPIPDLDSLEPVELDPAAYLGTLEQRSRKVTQLETKQRGGEENGINRRRWLVAAAAIVVTGIAVLLINGNDDTPFAGQQEDPAATIHAYIAAYNAGDIDALMELFADDATMTGQPFGGATPAEGKAEISRIQVRDMAAAATENAYAISNVEVRGNTVTWDHVWVNDGGSEYCAVGHSAVIENGKILSWTWPSAGLCR